LYRNFEEEEKVWKRRLWMSEKFLTINREISASCCAVMHTATSYCFTYFTIFIYINNMGIYDMYLSLSVTKTVSQICNFYSVVLFHFIFHFILTTKIKS